MAIRTYALVGLGAVMVVGCMSFRGKPPVRATPNVPEFRAASESQPPLPIEPPPPPKVEATSTNDESPLRRLAMKAADTEKTLNTYIVRIRRRETINGKDQPEEIIQFKYRRGPMSVHCKWLGKEGHGREIVYVKGGHGDKIHILTGDGDLLGAGRKLALAPDSYLVRQNMRYPVAEVSLGAAAVRYITAVDAFERGPQTAGAVKYLGQQTRPEFPQPVEAAEHTIPAGVEPALPKGGVRFYYFDPHLGNLPAVIVTFDHNRNQVEYYHFDRLQTPVGLDDADFDPAVIWKK